MTQTMPGSDVPVSWPAPAADPPAGWVETASTRTSRRPFTFVILGWNALMAAWICYAVFATASQSSKCALDAYSDACRTGTAVGGTLVIGGILFLTAIVDVILAVIWMVTKKKD